MNIYRIKTSLAFVFIRLARRLGISALPINTEDGFEITNGLSDMNLNLFSNTDKGFITQTTLFHVFTMRIRDMFGERYGTQQHIMKRGNANAEEARSFIFNITSDLSNLTAQDAKKLLHWADCNAYACRHLGKYPGQAAWSVMRYLYFVAADEPKDKCDEPYQAAIRDVDALMMCEVEHPDDCWQLPKKWK